MVKDVYGSVLLRQDRSLSSTLCARHAARNMSPVSWQKQRVWPPIEPADALAGFRAEFMRLMTESEQVNELLATIGLKLAAVWGGPGCSPKLDSSLRGSSRLTKIDSPSSSKSVQFRLHGGLHC